MKFRIGSKIKWKWLGREIYGSVLEVHAKSVTKTIKGKAIKRNGTKEKPAYLVESEAGNLALKLETELSASTRAKSSDKKSAPKSKPTMFSK